jgi:hypothetical protein
MLRRGMNHKSPFAPTNHLDVPVGHVNTTQSLRALRGRCKECLR